MPVTTSLQATPFHGDPTELFDFIEGCYQEYYKPAVIQKFVERGARILTLRDTAGRLGAVSMIQERRIVLSATSRNSTTFGSRVGIFQSLLDASHQDGATWCTFHVTRERVVGRSLANAGLARVASAAAMQPYLQVAGMAETHQLVPDHSGAMQIVSPNGYTQQVWAWPNALDGQPVV